MINGRLSSHQSYLAYEDLLIFLEIAQPLLQMLRVNGVDDDSDLPICAFRIIALPIPIIKKLLQPLYGNASAIFSMFSKKQLDVMQQAFLNKEFRKFLFSSNLEEQAIEFVESIITTPLDNDKTLENNRHEIMADILANVFIWGTPESLVQHILKMKYFQVSYKELVINSILDDLLDIEVVKKNEFDSIKIIEDLILEDKQLPSGSKKNLLKKILIDRILRQDSYEKVFDIITSLNEPKYDVIRERDEYLSTSLSGSGMKNKNGDVILVGNRFNEIRRVAKEKMYEIALQDNSADILLSKEEYREFMFTQRDGFWLGFDSLLSYFMKTNSEKKLINLESKNKNASNPISNFFTNHVNPSALNGVKSALSHVTSYFWQQPEKAEIELMEEAVHIKKKTARTEPRP